jgi:hypothetical protein
MQDSWDSGSTEQRAALARLRGHADAEGDMVDAYRRLADTAPDEVVEHLARMIYDRAPRRRARRSGDDTARPVLTGGLRGCRVTPHHRGGHVTVGQLLAQPRDHGGACATGGDVADRWRRGACPSRAHLIHRRQVPGGVIAHCSIAPEHEHGDDDGADDQRGDREGQRPHPMGGTRPAGTPRLCVQH